MPKTRDQEYDKNISDSPGRGYSAASERDVDIVSKPSRERNMPSPPKLGDVSAEVGSAEVGHQVKAKKFGCTDGDIRIAGEVTIDLKGKEYRSHH